MECFWDFLLIIMSLIGYHDGQLRSYGPNWRYRDEDNVWQILSIDGNEIKLISDCVEFYVHEYGQAEKSERILRNRDCSMYENKYAVKGSAHIFTAEEALEVFNYMTDSGYNTVEEWYESGDSYDEGPFDIDGSYFLANKYNNDEMYCLYEGGVYSTGDYSGIDAIRIVVTLSGPIYLEGGNGEYSPWEFSN